MGFDSGRAATSVEAGRISSLVDHEAYASFAAIPSNLRAVETSLLFAVGQAPYCVLYGPSGWGKSSLVRAMSDLSSALNRQAPTCVTSVELVKRYRSLDPLRPLVLEDAQESFKRQKDRALLQQILERRIRAKHPTFLVMTADPCVSELRRCLPYFRRWTLSRIGAPSAPERRVIAHMMAESEGLQLADPLLGLLSSKLNGNGLSLQGALKRLRLAGEVWKTDEQILQACGVLNPFFLDNGSFDLGHTIFDCARGLTDQPQELAAYAMRSISRLPEDAVARHLEVSPSEVFRMANRITRRLGQSEELRHQAARLTHLVVKEIG
jgi:chromosomal replication initiation ATPase DnaA